jgi:hypothetical protein
MLVTLTAVTLLLFHDVLQLAASPHTEPSMLVMAAACGLFVAPCLTMLCRSTLAAVVFTIAIPGLLATGADVVGGLIYGLQNAAAIDHFKLVVFWRGMFLICAVSAVAGWRMFLRLEVIEGHGPHVELPDSLRRDVASADTRPRPRHPVWALLGKELHLHQMAFVAAAIYVLFWLAMLWLERSTPNSPSLPLIPLTIFYGVVLSLLVGAMSSAEERQMGTLDWQLLLPVPAWKQWMVKTGAAFALALLLCVGLPLLLHGLGPAREATPPYLWRSLFAAVVLLTAGSMWVSTLCKSGVAALVASFPTVFATMLLGRTILDADLLNVRLWHAAGARASYASAGDAIFTMLPTFAVGLVALLLWLAFGNHRSADRRVARGFKQALAIASYITVGLSVLVALGLR